MCATSRTSSWWKEKRRREEDVDNDDDGNINDDNNDIYYGRGSCDINSESMIHMRRMVIMKIKNSSKNKNKKDDKGEKKWRDVRLSLRKDIKWDERLHINIKTSWVVYT